MIQRLYLILKEVVGSRVISVIVLLSVLMSVFAVGLYRIVGDNLNNYIRNKFASSIPPNTIKVSVRQPVSYFLFELEKPKMAIITDRVLRRIRVMEGVTEINPVAALRIPSQVRIIYMGHNYRSDILSFGVPYRLVREEIRGARYRTLWNNYSREKVIPVLVPRTLLQSYNDGMAGPNSLPRISEQGAIGFGFKLLMGKSSIRSIEGYEEMDGVIAGFTDQIDSFALLIPLGQAVAYNKKFIEQYRNEYQYAYVKVKDHGSLIRVSPLIKKLGFVVEAEKSVSQQIMKLRDIINLIVVSLQAVILIIAVIAIAFATVIATLSRIEYYRTLRIIGCSKIFLTGTILVKYAIVGSIGAWAGMELLNYVTGQFIGFFHLTGVMLSLSIPPETRRTVLIYGTLIPVLSTLPALVRLYVKELSRD